MKVLLSTLNSKFIHTNLAIRYIREYSRDLEGKEYKVDLKEYTINNSIDYIIKDIYKRKIDILAMSTYIWNIEDTIRLCENLKKINPDLIIILGGPEVSYDYIDSINKYKCIDYILYGEGERIYRELIENLLGKIDISKVRGIAYRKGGYAVENPPMPLIENLNDIPSPYENIDVREYENKIVYFESSRGCPFNCQYCLSSAIKGLRYFSTDRIKRDLKNLIDARVSQIKFIDRTFNANREIAKNIMRFLMENDNGITTYHFEVTAHLIDDDMLHFLKNCKPGLFQFEIGVQSTNLQTLKAVGRYDDFKRLTKVVNTISSYRNIHQHLDLIAGLPYEDFDRFSQSFDDVFSLKSQCLQLGFLKMIKGTGIRERSDEFDYVYKDYPPYEILSNKFMTYEQILELKDIEEILEIYYNSRNFSLSIEYLLERYYDSPFKFFREMASYFNENGYFDLANAKNKLYEILLDFAKERVFKSKNKLIENDIFNEVVKFDYISIGKVTSLPVFLNRIDVNDYKNKGHKFLQIEENQVKYTPNNEFQAAKNIIRHVHFEEFKYNIMDIKKDLKCKIEQRQNTILFYYNIDKIFEKSYAYEVILP
ncbi:B12-binding domain-containing radical SAM protein [Peptostreptococcus equinus]|uniref:B12-binding domain-containing radical SAM protein n=1 Tax=Peptostreptococcus equinus TaxID=3003601 RepID=A0ABY7JP79_9FIRM|nr:B12-binding domain-containing radical SAM protein [Peptostreptococcus sp. CBA3647]WAW15178.1 B12-binding domain-containing radical SAM protein [Peptostreptococcus sp. CBA3647]